MKTLNAIFVLLFGIVVFNAQITAQNNYKITPKTETIYSTSSSTNNLNSLTKVKPQQDEFTSEKKNLLKQLDEARASNNILLKEQLESQLNKLNGIEPVRLTENYNIIGGAAANSKPPFNNEPDYMSSQILQGPIWASATQTESADMPHPGRLWVAAALFSNGAGDTCKVYFSDNGGQTWTFGYFFLFTTNVDFKAGELDIELVYDGSILWIYGVAGYTDIGANRTYSMLFRFNTSSNIYNGYTLVWPENSTVTNKYYNPRITSDNSNYTVSSYLYLSCSFDSTTGSSHFARQKYAHVENPFDDPPTIDYDQPSSNGGFFWHTSGLPANAYLWADIGYFKTTASNNRIYTVYNIQGAGDYNLYTAWSDDYGATLEGSAILTETSPDYGAKIAFNGGNDNNNGIIAYVRSYTSTDWDPYARLTTNGGANWTSSYIDLSVNRARSVDVIAPRGANNIFKAAYVQDSSSGPVGYYTGGNGTGWTQPLSHPVTIAGVDSSFSKIIAGYNSGGGDDCLAVYSIGIGTNLYASRLCGSTIGINNTNTGVPKTYSLEQNYPNPFNPSTNINFSIPKAGFVRMVIYDITGKTIATLVNEQLNAGNYKYDFDASNLASGVYFYRLEANDFSAVKKMLLVK